MTEILSLREQKLALEIQQLEHKVRREAAEARISELNEIVAETKERDRQARPGFRRSINFFGGVTAENVDQVIDALEHWAARDPGEPVTITFNTQGGSVTDGLALYDTIQRLRRNGHEVTTRAVGVAASMGAVLLQAGDTRIIDSRAKILIHEGSTGGGGKMTAGEAEDYAAFWKMLRDDILDILAERSTLSKKQIENRWKRRDWWLSAQEAVKYGFADRVE